MTISCKEVENWWNGKVIIDEIKEYVDSRGSLVELWRSDDTKMQDDGFDGNTVPEMSYWSVTKPYVLRGPHQHENQTDWFVTLKGRMVYQLYNPDTKEMKFFVTDPSKIYRVKVAPPIIHSYRNLQTTDIVTGNFPTALFMGKDKKGYSSTSKIDEIRHEHVVESVKNIWVLGANGRLGKELVARLYADMGYHSYNVIPISDKFTNDRAGIEAVKALMDVITLNKKDGDIIINCIAKSNVQSGSDDFLFSNFSLPVFLTEIAVRENIHFVQFSTDYVFQTGEVSNYTRSKKKYEEWVDSVMETPILYGVEREQVYKYLHIIRLANLFSQDADDVHNLLNKLNSKLKAGAISAPPSLLVMPTDVAAIAEYLSKEYIPNIDKKVNTVNLSGKPYTIQQLVEKFLGLDPTVVEDGEQVLEHNVDRFLDPERWVELDCDLAILKKFATIKQN